MFHEVILIPGLLCDGRLWAAQATGLADTARTRVPDLSAYESIAEAAEGVLHEAPKRFDLAGFSMGGCVALEIVGRAAAGRVCRLALLSTNHAGILPSVRQHYLDSIASIEAGGLDAYLADAFPLYVAPERAHDQALGRIFSAMGKSLGPVVAVRQMRCLMAYQGFSGDLGKIACPTAVVCGKEDRRTPVEVHEELAGRIPGARLLVIEGAGHFTPLEAPEKVTEALRDWLGET